MNTYELLYCFKPTLDPDSVEASIKNVENAIINLKGKIVKTDKLGRKKLAYDVNKFRDGFYVTSYINLDPDKVKNLKRTLKLNENVIRNLILRIDDPDTYPSLVNSLQGSTAQSQDDSRNNNDNKKHDSSKRSEENRRQPVASE